MARPDDFLNLLAEYLDDNGLDNVFAGKYPGKPNNVTALLGLQGTSIGVSRDVAALQFPRFQLITRNTDYQDASVQMQVARGLLHGQIGLILPEGVNTATEPYVRILKMHAEQDGGPIGQDEQGRYEFAINFNVEYHNINT